MSNDNEIIISEDEFEHVKNHDNICLVLPLEVGFLPDDFDENVILKTGESGERIDVVPISVTVCKLENDQLYHLNRAENVFDDGFVDRTIYSSINHLQNHLEYEYGIEIGEFVALFQFWNPSDMEADNDDE